MNMPTLIEYFNNDFGDLSLDRAISFTAQKTNEFGEVDIETFEVKERIRHHMQSSVRYFTYYVPQRLDTLNVIIEVIRLIPAQVKAANDLIVIGNFTGDEPLGNHQIVYSNRIYFYNETELSDQEKQILDEFSKSSGVYLTVRSQSYIMIKMDLEKPKGFISHDSRDKDLIARVLALGLSSRLCTVWYDEFTLKIGDSLRESIEQGIKEAKKCILIITPNFLSNPGWGKKEFSSIFTREMIFNERVVLPIWYGVTKEQVYEYSPSLADTLALIWPSPENISDDEYKKQVEIVISKIHAAIAV